MKLGNGKASSLALEEAEDSESVVLKEPPSIGDIGKPIVDVDPLGDPCSEPDSRLSWLFCTSSIFKRFRGDSANISPV